MALGRGSPLCDVACCACKGQLSHNLESIGLGAVTNFFDTLGFCSHDRVSEVRKMVPDSSIPSKLNAGHWIPTIVEALTFINLVSVASFFAGSPYCGRPL
jgi:hypothetical protein